MLGGGHGDWRKQRRTMENNGGYSVLFTRDGWGLGKSKAREGREEIKHERTSEAWSRPRPTIYFSLSPQQKLVDNNL
jgi:hypothetical protein